jgi:hypothetical protein
MTKPTFPRAVLFDLLTALLDSWTVWNSVAGSETRGVAWRAEYLRLTYGCGAYVPYERLVRAAARTAGLPDAAADALEERWPELAAWDGAQAALDILRGRTKLAVVTNCSERLGMLAAGRLNIPWDCVVTAEAAGYYKPDPVLIVLHSPGWTCRQPRPRSSPVPATTCSVQVRWVCAFIGTIASDSRVPTAHRRHISNRQASII